MIRQLVGRKIRVRKMKIWKESVVNNRINVSLAEKRYEVKVDIHMWSCEMRSYGISGQIRSIDMRGRAIR